MALNIVFVPVYFPKTFIGKSYPLDNNNWLIEDRLHTVFLCKYLHVIELLIIRISDVAGIWMTPI